MGKRRSYRQPQIPTHEVLCLMCEADWHNLCRGDHYLIMHHGSKPKRYRVKCICLDPKHQVEAENNEYCEDVEVTNDLL